MQSRHQSGVPVSRRYGRLRPQLRLPRQRHHAQLRRQGHGRVPNRGLPSPQRLYQGSSDVYDGNCSRVSPPSSQCCKKVKILYDQSGQGSPDSQALYRNLEQTSVYRTYRITEHFSLSLLIVKLLLKCLPDSCLMQSYKLGGIISIICPVFLQKLSK